MPKKLSNRERLAQHMDERRLQLDMRWADVAAGAGLTTETLRQVRSGTGEIRPLTRRKVERALLWKQGSVTRILEGGEPTTEERAWGIKVSPEPPPPPVPDRRELHRLVDQLPDDQLSRALDILKLCQQ